MKPQAFANLWTASEEHSLCPLSPERVKNLNLKPETIEFLTVSGLPDNAAPYLNFIRDRNDLYDGINKLTAQYDFLESEYEKFVVIGSDGNGNLLVINTSENDRIEWLDHEAEFSSRYINSSIHTFAENLLHFRNFLDTVLKENGEDAYLNSNFSDNQLDDLRQKIHETDPNALTEEGFWKEELKMMLDNRAEFLAKE